MTALRVRASRRISSCRAVPAATVVAAMPEFTVAAAAAGAGTPPRRYSIEVMADPLAFAGGLAATGFRALALTGTVVAAGAVAFARLVAPRAGIAPAAEVPLARLGAAGAFLVAIGAPFRVWTQASAFALEPAETWSYVPRVLGTTWGVGATAQTIAALALAFGLRRAVRRAGSDAATGGPAGARRDVPGRALTVAGTLGLIVTPAMMGHAIADE